MRFSCAVALALTMMACSSSGQGPAGADSGGNGSSSGGMPGDSAALSDDGGSSSGSSGGPSDAVADGTDMDAPSIDPSTPFVNLTSSQIGEVCDWQEGLLGGYGAVIACQSGNTNNFANQAQCVEALTFSPGGCTMTLGEYEACVEARAPSKGCEYPDPQCTKFFYCHRASG